MRYAIISDIHANEDALRVVLTDARDERVDRIVCLGDVLGYGPDAVAALELIYREAHICLAGNHDDAASGRFPDEDFTEFALAAIKRHRAALAQKALEWLKTLPYVCEMDGFACTHANFVKPEEFDYILEAADAKSSFDVREEQLLFAGHTHEPCVFVLGASGVAHKLEADDFVLEDGKRYIVNPGSVGYPRNGDCRSGYCIYDTAARTVYFRSLPFDLERYRKKMNGKGMDEAPWIAARAKERVHAAVRNEERFGKPGKKNKLRKANVNSVPEQTVPVHKREQNLKPLLIRSIVLSAVIIAIAGLVCTMKLTSEKIPKPMKDVEIKSLALPTTDRADVDTRFVKSIPLSGGWSVAFENATNQTVEIERNAKKNVTAFRIENREECCGKLSRSIDFFGKHQTIALDIKLLTKPLPGKKVPFSFRSNLIFLNDRGKEVGEFPENRKTSLSKKFDIPESATSARWEIIYRCRGTYDLAIPNYEFDRIKPKRNRQR